MMFVTLLFADRLLYRMFSLFSHHPHSISSHNNHYNRQAFSLHNRLPQIYRYVVFSNKHITMQIMNGWYNIDTQGKYCNQYFIRKHDFRWQMHLAPETVWFRFRQCTILVDAVWINLKWNLFTFASYRLHCYGICTPAIMWIKTILRWLNLDFCQITNNLLK